ncbi:MJ0042-type zinc finger domain-containing protein [Brevundimonas sp.]|uniref:MJ0042-type zinc finger domain-containing protein n=1 Tax=Brevundimonas sp. TaxID=1871086 RepID=UPI003568EF7C
MILTCPSCATSYFTPDEAIGASGRAVRCKACRHTWRASLDEPLELSASPPAVEATSFGKRDEPVSESLAEMPAPELPRAFRARAEQQRRLRRAATHGAVWASIASGFAALIGAAWLYRVEVVEMVPRAAAAYAAVGLTVNPTGLEFESVTARAAPDDPGKVLISGNLRNVRENERIAPPVRVALLDADGVEIGHAVVRIDAAPVLPGRVQAFAAVIPDPGARGQLIGVNFVLDVVVPPRAPAKAAPHADTARGPTPVAPAPTGHAMTAEEASGLRPALEPGPSGPLDMQPIDAVPVTTGHPIDSHGSEAVSASHG